MTRDQAWQLVNELVTSPNLIKHLLSCEAIMRALYRKLVLAGAGQQGDWDTEDNWGNVGLLHDADQDITQKSMELHTEEITKKLQAKGEKQQVIDAIGGHADKVERSTLMAKAIYACDELSGLIVASVLVRPDKKIGNLSTDSALKRFKEPSFAKGANREMIKTCQTELGIPLEEFVDIALKAMQEISDQLEL